MLSTDTSRRNHEVGHSEDGTVRPLDVKAGDRVLFGKWAGTEVLIGGEDRLILKDISRGDRGRPRQGIGEGGLTDLRAAPADDGAEPMG